MPGLAIPAAIALLLGVAGSAAWPRSQSASVMLLTGAAILVGVAAATRRAPFLAAALVLLAFAGGWCLGLRAHHRALDQPLRTVLNPVLTDARAETIVVLEGRLREDVAVGADGAWIVLDVQRVRRDGAWMAVGGGVRLGVRGALDPVMSGEWRRGRCIRAPAWLRVPSAFRNPGVGDADLDLARRGVALVGSVKSAALVEVCGRGSWVQERAGLLRTHLRRAIARHVGPHGAQSAAIVTAIVLGDRGPIDDEVEERLRRAGTFHVIAISGGNIAILTGVLLWALVALRAPPRVAALGALAGLVLYALTVVRGASVDRAVLVAIAYLAARVADVEAGPLPLLASTASLLALWNPMVVFDVGFALTFGATAGLIVVTPHALSWWRARVVPRIQGRLLVLLLRPIVALLAATMAAEAAVIPISASAFGRVTFAGLVLNFLAIPLMGVVQIAGLLVAVLSPASPTVADAFGYVAHLAVTGMVDSARLVEWWPWMSRAVPTPSTLLVAAYAVALVLACLPNVGARIRAPAGAAAAALALAMAAGWLPARSDVFARALPPAHRQAALRVTVLDVAQGDAVLVQFPHGPAMLVDAGGLAGSPRFDIGRRVISRALHALGVTRLDWLVVTHGDPDHIGGAPAVIEDWRPREVWEGIAVPGHIPGRALRALAERHGAAWREVRVGDRLWVDGVGVSVWHPHGADWERQRVRNDDSVVLEFSLGDVSIVLPGDIGAVVEQRLAASVRPRPFVVLKAAHHGSGGSSDAQWLGRLAPSAVVYSCGLGNMFGHPAAAATSRAAAVGATLFGTDRDGAVHIATDGERVAVVTMSGKRWLRRVR